MSSRAVALLGYLVIVAVLLAWEGFGLARGDDDWPTVSDIIRSLTWPPARWTVFAIWLWTGWHVFVRTWGRP